MSLAILQGLIKDAIATVRAADHTVPFEGEEDFGDELGIAIWENAGSMGGLESGDLIMTGRTTARSGFLLCDGAAVSRTTFADLFAAIGTTFGIGDGSTTFNVPDLRQRFPLGKAASGTGSTLGSTGGNIDHTHDLANHWHYQGEGHDNTNTEYRIDDNPRYGSKIESRSRHQTSIGNASSGGEREARGNVPNTNVTSTGNPPFLVVNYIIKT